MNRQGIRESTLRPCDSQHLAQRGDPGSHLPHSIFAEGPHAPGRGQVPQVAGPGLERGAQFVVHHQQLVDTEPPAIPGVPALIATSAAKDAQQRPFGLRIVVVTMHVDPVLVDAAVGLGAGGFVPKDAGVEELKSAISEVAAGRRYVSRRIRRRGPRGNAVDRMGFSQLTPRQQEIVRMIGRGLKGEEIAEQLGLTLNTVRFHRKNIGRLLGLESEWAMVRYAILVGMAEDPTDKA
jgi:DNA-binding NarL/FixJ family response regulator